MKKLFTLFSFLIAFALPAAAQTDFCVRSGSFATGTGAGNIAVTFGTGTNCTPKAVILWTSASPGATTTDDYSISFGFATSSTSRRALWTGCLDNTDPSECDNRVNNALVLMTYRGTTPTLVGSLDFVSMDTDGFTVDPITAYVANSTVFYQAWGGSDITNVGIATITQPLTASPTDFSDTTLGFQPSFLLLASTRATTNDANTADAQMNIGFTDGTNAALWSGYAATGSASSATTLYARSAASQKEVMAEAAGSAAVFMRDDFKSFDTNGFTLTANEIAEGGGAVIIYALAFKGARWVVGDYTSPGATGTFSETGLSWQPKSLFVLHNRLTAQSTSDVSIARTIQSIGSTISTTARGAASSAANDAVATNTEYAQGQSTGKLWYVLNGAGTLVSDGDLTSFDANGFTLNQTTFNVSFTFGIYFASTGNAAAGGGVTPIRRRQVIEVQP